MVLKVLFVSEYFPPKIMGGGEINLFLLAKALAKQGMEVNVLTSWFKGLKKYEEIDGIKVYRRLKTSENASSILGNLKRSYSFPKSIVKEAKKIDYDIIHFIGTSIIAAKVKGRKVATIESFPCLCPKGDMIYKGRQECKYDCTFSRFISCQAKSSEIGKMQNKWYLRYNPVFLIYVYRYYSRLRKGMKKCNIIAISEYIRNLIKTKKQIQVIPNALDVAKYNVKGKKGKIVYLGSLTKFKGPQVLIEALKGLDYECELYGDGVLKKSLLKKIKEYNLNVKIKEKVDYKDIPKVYADADIVVFPSVWPEPFGRIAIEGMAAGKPVIGSNIAGITETLKQGMLVEPGNVEQLREAILMLKNDKKLRDSLGKKGQKLAKEYDEKHIAKKVIEFYNKLYK